MPFGLQFSPPPHPEQPLEKAEKKYNSRNYHDHVAECGNFFQADLQIAREAKTQEVNGAPALHCYTPYLRRNGCYEAYRAHERCS